MTWKKELGRKVFHLSWGLVLLSYLQLEKNHGSAALIFPFSLFMIFLAIDYFRIQHGFKIPLFWRLLHDKEANTLFTPTTTMAGMTMALAVFSREIAVAAIMMMVFGDIAANIAGKLFGRTMIGQKTMEGAAAGLAVNLAVGFLILSNIFAVAIMAITASATELYTTKLDDNMLIILFAGSVGQLILFAL